MAKERYKVIPAVFVIFEKENKIALIRRFQTGYMDGKYSLPSGHLDGGESFTNAAIREANEEVGVKIVPENLEFVHFLHNAKADEDCVEYINVYFKCEKWEGEIYNAEPEKCDDLIWVDKEGLSENVIDHVKEAIEFSYKKNTYSEYGF